MVRPSRQEGRAATSLERMADSAAVGACIYRIKGKESWADRLHLPTRQ